MENKRETFVVFYSVGKVLKSKNIISTFENCDKDANKASKKWHDVIVKRHIDKMIKQTRIKK